VGGVDDPANARWSEDSEVASEDADTLPEIGEMDWLPTKAQ